VGADLLSQRLLIHEVCRRDVLNGYSHGLVEGNFVGTAAAACDPRESFADLGMNIILTSSMRQFGDNCLLLQFFVNCLYLGFAFVLTLFQGFFSAFVDFEVSRHGFFHRFLDLVLGLSLRRFLPGAATVGSQRRESRSKDEDAGSAYYFILL
jgi:hypothetical protein